MLPNKQKIMESILNKKEEDLFSIATVVNVDPCTIKFPPDDTAIPAVPQRHLLGISTGSRVMVLRYGKQYIITGVLGNPVTNFTEYVVKSADETRNNTTTYAEDSELTLTLPANGEYLVEIGLITDGVSTTPDFKLSYNHSNVTELTYRECWGMGDACSTDAYNADRIITNAQTLSGEAHYATTNYGWASIQERIKVSTGSSAGTITPKYAQITATAEDVTVKQKSWIKYTRIDSFPYGGSGNLQDILDDIDDLQTDVATNTSNIATNTSNIATNTSNIATNTSNITTNTSNISTNTSNISTNTSNISTNTSNISTNTSNITTNANDISDLQTDVSDLETEVLDAQSDITDLQNDKQPNIAVVRKTADESVTSSTTLQNDNHLTYTFPSAGVYEVNLNLIYNGSTTGDILCDWTTSGTVTIYSQRMVAGCYSGMTSAFNTTLKYRGYSALSDDVTYGAYANTCLAKENFLVNVSSGATITFRWAQDTSDTTATVVEQGSYMKILKVTT